MEKRFQELLITTLLSSYIDKLTNVLFNLDLFEVMEKDLDHV